MSALSYFAPRALPPGLAAKARSLTCLSLLCFALADVRDGLGPFLGIFLQSHGWTPDSIGYVMTIGGLAGMAVTTPLGALADATRRKRLLLALASTGIVAALALIFLCQHPLLVGCAQIVQAVCAAAMAPAISGLTLGLAGQSHLPAQLGRNEAWNHAGNGLSAMLGGAIGYWYGVPGVFAVMCCMLLLSLYALHGIAPRDIDHAQARGLAPEADDAAPARRAALWHGPAALPVLCVGLVMLFFHLGNAHMLPLLGQSAVARFAINGAAYTAATVVIAQGTMILVALQAARLARRRGYGILLWCALLALPLRGCIAGFWHSPWSIIPVQVLDGVGAGILGVVTPGLAARLLNGTGHVNLGLGIIMTLQGIGASCSASYGGLVAHLLGYGPAFLALAAAPCVALGILLAAVRRLPRLHHATMETHACIADYDPYSDMLTVYCPNQAVHGIRTVLADFLEMPESHVRVVKATMGGSFGAKQEWFLEPVTALVAKKLCRPVKLVYSRGEAMTDTIVRGAMRMSTRGYYTPDGEMKKIYCDVTLDAGAYIGNAGDYVRALAGKPTRCYRIPYMHYHGQVISSNSPVSGAFRSWSAAEEALMMERQLDAAAEKLGMDRLAIRLKNVARSGEEDKKLHLSLEDIRIGDAITLGSEKFGWDKLKAEDAAFNASQQRYRRGVGIGIGGHGNTYFPRFNDYGEGSISLNADGSMQANFTLHDHGCGTVTAMRMIAAEVLKVPEDKIYMTEGDTAVTPIDYGCFASRTTYVVGRAVQDAANALRKKMLHAASTLLDIPEDELFLNDSHICRAGQDEPLLSFAELAKKSMHTHAGNLTACASYSNVTNPGVTGAHFAHVEVDTWTGFTKVLDYLAVHDIGQAINPGLCEAQIQGAVQMGCGAALREKMTMQKDGRCTESLSKYHLFLATDLPNIRVELLQDGRSKEGPFGAKSIGEVCYVPVAPAVCGAVNDALHANLSVLPYDPDCILKYLAEVRENHDA